jgi:NAD(P)H-dependent FMN reductase
VPANDLTLKVIVVSTRPGRQGRAIGDWFNAFARTHPGFTSVELVDLQEMDLPLFDEPNHPMSGEYVHDHTKQWSEAIASADAFAIVLPEYNFFVPPSIVNALDYLHHEWKYKAAAIVGYGGASGGMRAGQALKPLLANLSIMPTNPSLYFHGFQQFTQEDGSFNPGVEQQATAVNVLDELAKWAGALKPLRQT